MEIKAWQAVQRAASALKGPRGNARTAGHADLEVSLGVGSARAHLRRGQAKARRDAPPKGLWGKLIRDAAKDMVVEHAAALTAREQRKT